MRDFLRTSFIAIALAFVFGALFVPETSAQINDILKRMDEHYKALQTLRADIKMVKYDGTLKVTEESDIYEGKVMYLPEKGRNASILVKWSKPEESLSVVDKKYVIYRPRLKQAFVGNVNSTKGSAGATNPLSFINMSKEQLKANFNIRYLGQENVNGGTPTWHLELVPKNASKYRTSDIWVDGSGMPIQMKTTETNNDTVTILLTNLDKKSPINRQDFIIVLPKGTKVIDK
jgi:outer membrane lipoprotein-sorting protein